MAKSVALSHSRNLDNKLGSDKLAFFTGRGKITENKSLDKNCNVHSNMPPRRDDSHIFFLDRPNPSKFRTPTGFVIFV